MKQKGKRGLATVRWTVYRIRKKGERLGTVEARDQAEALQRAYELFAVAEKDRPRIAVMRGPRSGKVVVGGHHLLPSKPTMET